MYTSSMFAVTVAVLVVMVLVMEVSHGARILLLPVPEPVHLAEAIALAAALRDITHHSPVLALPSLYATPRALQDVEVMRYTVPGLVLGGRDYAANLTARALLQPGDGEALRFQAAVISEHCRAMLADHSFMHASAAGAEEGFAFAVVDGYAWNPCMAVVAVHLRLPFAVWSSTLHPYHIRVTFDATVPAFGAEVSWEMSSVERLWSLWCYMTSDIDTYHDSALLATLPVPVQSWAGLLRKAKVFVSSVDDTLAWHYAPVRGFLRLPGLLTGNARDLNGTLAHVVATKATGSDIVVSFGLFRHLPKSILGRLLRGLGATEKLVLADLQLSGQLKLKVPSNVHMEGELPLNDVLGHSAFRVLVSACDCGVVYQALYHGVPVLCLPVLGEQHHTAHRLVERGYGVRMDLSTFTERELVRQVSALLRPSSPIRDNCRRLALFLHKRKSLPVADAAQELDAAVMLGAKYRSSPGARALWYVFLVEGVLMVAVAVALVKISCWCKDMCDEEEQEDNKHPTQNIEPNESKKDK